MKFGKYWMVILSLLVLSLGFWGQPAAAAEPTGLTGATLWVDPEYDDQRLLVMFEGQIAGLEAPAEIRFLVPASAEIFSAGSIDAAGKYSGGPPARKASQVAGWDEVSYTLTSTTFRLEYYNDIIKGFPDKTVAFDFRWLYPIEDMNVVFQQPENASNFKVTSNGAPLTEHGAGLFVVAEKALTLDPGGQPLHFDIAYTRSDTSVAQPQPTASSGVSGLTNNTPLLIAILVMVTVLVIVAIIIVVLLLKRNSGSAAARATANRGPGERSGSSGKNKKKVQTEDTCEQCGKAVDKNERFCANCGNETR